MHRPRTITTTGDATVNVTPDEVRISFGLEIFNKSLQKAKSVNQEESAKLLAAIRAVGVEEKEIQTDTVFVDINYDNNERDIAGYTARRGYTVTTKNVKLFEKIIDAALENGANRLMGFEFRTTQLRKYRDQARKMAILAAKEKAVDLASALDVKVGLPRTISEGEVESYGGGGWWSWWGYGGNNQAGQNSIQNVASGGPGNGDDAAQTLPLGQIGVHAKISVTFDIAKP